MESGKGQTAGRDLSYRERAEAYDRHLASLRRKLASYQGCYLQMVRREAEETHCKWLLANQDLLKEELRALRSR